MESDTSSTDFDLLVAGSVELDEVANILGAFGGDMQIRSALEEVVTGVERCLGVFVVVSLTASFLRRTDILSGDNLSRCSTHQQCCTCDKMPQHDLDSVKLHLRMSLFPIPKASNSRQQNAYTASNDFNAALPNSELHCLGCINSMSPQHQQSELRTTTGSFAKHRGTFRLQGQLINSNVHSTTFKHDPHFPSNHFLLNSHSHLHSH